MRLRRCGIENALHLRQAPSLRVRQHLTITGARLQRELRGISCIPLGSTSAKKTITCSRSLGRLVWNISELQEAITCFVDSAAEKLRRQQSAVGLLQVFLRTDKHRTDLRQQLVSAAASFPVASAYTPELVTVAHRVLESIYTPGYGYAKVGILFCDLVPESERQLTLFDSDANDPAERERQHRLMNTTDSLNRRFGRGTVFLASAGTERRWQGKQEHRSPRYTTQWRELLEVI